MSLLSEAMETFVFVDKIRQPDGRGSYTVVWQDGAEFQAAATYDMSMTARAAQAAGETSMYTITTRKSVTLEFHDVIRRLRDGKIMRITSDGDDNYTPASASLNMRQVKAEEWVLPNG